MALLFYTGFDYFDQTQTQRLFTYYSGGSSLVPGRFGGRGWLFNNESGFLSTLIPNTSTVILGMAFSFAYGSSTNPFLVFQDATTSRISPLTQTDLRITNDGAFQFTRNGTVLTTTSSYLVTFNAWNYLEIKVNTHNSTGYVQLRLNGQTFLNDSGLDTQNTGNNYVNMIRFQPFASSGAYNFKIDDVYICDDSGSSPHNGFLGECRVQTQRPSANGDTNQFLTVGAFSNYQAVDEIIADDDTSYVKSGTVGNVDDYVMGSVDLTGTIYGVQVNVTHKKDDVGSRSICPIINSGGTIYEGTSVVSGSDYVISQKMWETNPNGNSPWTNSTVNALTAGIKIKG